MCRMGPAARLHHTSLCFGRDCAHVTRPGIVERPAPVVHGRRGSSAFLPSLNGATTATNTHWPYMETLLIVYYIFKLG
jgi:hypothetical protein